MAVAQSSFHRRKLPSHKDGTSLMDFARREIYGAIFAFCVRAAGTFSLYGNRCQRSNRFQQISDGFRAAATRAIFALERLRIRW
jgi:hypothetical protein